MTNNEVEYIIKNPKISAAKFLEVFFKKDSAFEVIIITMT
jgi:hypothetical protein